jgi:hypothetical protein
MKNFSQSIKKSINLSNIDVLTKICEYERYECHILWSVIFLTLTGLTCWLMVLNFLNYFQYEVVSKIEVLNERPIEFPVVTLCDNNPLTTLYAQSLIDSITGFSTNLNYSESYSEIYKSNTNKFVIAKQKAKSMLSDEEKKKLGFNLSLIISCNFDGKTCDMKNDFHWLYSYDHGNCWQFNSGLNLKNERVNIKKSNMEGKENGLHILIWPLINLNKYFGLNSDGLVLFVHNKSNAPSLSERILLRSGKESQIGVRRIFSFNQPKPFSQCKETSESYRQMDCIDLCRQKLIINKCGCYFEQYDTIDSSPPCINSSGINCLNNLTTDREILTDDEFNECLNECPLECASIKYRLKLSTLKYPNEQSYLLFLEKNSDLVNFYLNLTGNQLSFSVYKEMTYDISVFYTSMDYTQITQSPKMQLFDLFSQIGGSIGVFMGMSVFHLIEIVEIICSLIGNYVSK